jgi:NhaP-type Na+/H+ or K+/H+ antiporter
VTTNQILIGLGLMVTLAVGSQVLASRLRIPALIVLLPVGFAAGALTDDVNPQRLFGATFPELVSLAVALILYDAGLSLNLRHLKGHTKSVVVRLVSLGTIVTWGFASAAAAILLGLPREAAVMIGAILVVSGPTVVNPLLNFVRPVERVRRILTWEGSLIDPVGAILGAVVFHGVTAGMHSGFANQVLQFVASIGVGLVGGLVGTVLLFLVRRLRLDEILGTSAQLALVVGVAAACDVVRADTGLISAIVMGLAVGNSARFDVPARRPFFETLIQLVLGLLFISISATVTPDSLHHLVLPTLGLVAVLVLVTRPLVVALATLRTDLTPRERGFVGWMAPRGIVAAATASTFSAALIEKNMAGATKILPVTFLVIVMTVLIYGLTARPVAQRLGVLRPKRARPLLVGDEPWVVDLGQTMRSAGLDVLMWAGREEQRIRILLAGLELAPGELLAAATGRGAQLEGITCVLLVTGDDDFNALAATVLQPSFDGPVYRLHPPRHDVGVVAPYTGGETLFGADLSRQVLAERWVSGASLQVAPAAAELAPGNDLLFVVSSGGRLACVTEKSRPHPRPDDSVILLGPAPVVSAAAAADTTPAQRSGLAREV